MTNKILVQLEHLCFWWRNDINCYLAILPRNASKLGINTMGEYLWNQKTYLVTQVLSLQILPRYIFQRRQSQCIHISIDNQCPPGEPCRNKNTERVMDHMTICLPFLMTETCKEYPLSHGRWVVWKYNYLLERF